MNSEQAQVDVRLPHALAHLFPDAPRRLSLHASDVSALIDALDDLWPGMGDCLRDTSPSLRRHINVFANGRRATLETKLAPGTDVFILTAINGG
jgi:hypothetical protein